MIEPRTLTARPSAARTALWLAALACVQLEARASAQERPPAEAETKTARPAQPAGSVDTTVRARQLFESGVAAYEAARYAEALALFQEAYRLRPHPLVRVNIANCFDKLDRPAEALENFQAFLSSGDAPSAQQEEVRSAIKELSKRVGHVEFRIIPSGARVMVDDQEERRAPIAGAVTLSVGRHRVNVAQDGYETALRAVDVKAQETTMLSVELAALPSDEAAIALAPAPPPAAAPKSDDGLLPLSAPAQAPPVEQAPPPMPERITSERPAVDSGTPVSVWLVGGVSVLFAVSAIATGQLSLAANHEFDSNLAAVRNPQLSELERAGAWAQGLDAANRADALAAATDVLLGLALVGAGVTTYLYLSRPDPVETRGASVRLNAGLGRLQLSGRF